MAEDLTHLTPEADPPMIVRATAPNGYVRVNASFQAAVGFCPAELAEKPLLEWIELVDRTQVQELLAAGEGCCVARHLVKSGGSVALSWRMRADETMVLGLSAPSAPLLDRESDSGMIDDRETVSATLATIARILEEQNPGYMCSILLLDKASRVVTGGAGPSLPAHYNEAVEGLRIGPTVGSCGTASFWNIPVIVEDIQSDPLWRDLAPLARKTGVNACWSHPFSSRDGRILGAVALYYPERRAPTAEQMSRLRTAARMTGLAVERGRAEEALREAVERLGQLEDSRSFLHCITDTANDGIVVADSTGKVVFWNQGAVSLFGWTALEALGRTLEFLIPRQFLTAHEEGWARFQASGSLAQEGRLVRVKATHKAGHDVAVDVALASFRDPHGQVMVTAILRDVSMRVQVQSLSEEREYLRNQLRDELALGEIIGQSQALKNVLAQVDLVASTHASVLIQGESGTGKELIARAIHERSGRRNNTLVKVNCCAIPPQLFESEFFGHVKGAFTGANRNRTGRFALADGGTLFLDEISEIPLELQAKLLRVLEEGTFEPVGSDRTRRSDARVVAATNRDLKAAVAAGTFRRDLYYRLNTFPLMVPPLRERPEDIEPLLRHFVRRYLTRARRPPVSITPYVLAVFQAYSWPGNVRELKNVVERLLITSPGTELNLSGVFPAQTQGAELKTPGAPSGETYLTQTQVDVFLRENTRLVMEAADWRVRGPGGAAERLGLKATTLTSRLKKLGLAPRLES
jgi:PAS domain S-box-containing protein